MATHDLTLQDHLQMLGMQPRLLAFCAKVPVDVVQRVLTGQEIAQPHAEAICRALSEEHGLKHATGYQPEDIKGMTVFQPPAKVTSEKPNPQRDRLLIK